MPCTLNKKAWERLIDENIEWLDNQPDTLECKHIREILEWTKTHRPDIQAERIKKLEAQLEQHRWIKTSERLPKKGNYLALYNDSEQRLIYEVGFISGKWYSMTGHEISFITHWMPIILP